MTKNPPQDRGTEAQEAWSVALPPAWPEARAPALSDGVIWVSAHRLTWANAEGDVVVLLAFDAKTGKPLAEARWTAEGKGVRTSAPCAAEAGGAIVTAYGEGGRLTVLRVDRYGRVTERQDVPEACPLSGRPHKSAIELRRVGLARPRLLASGGTVVAWVFGDGKGCVERYRSLSDPPLWAALATPQAAAGDVLVVKEAGEEDLLLAARDGETGERRWAKPGLDLEVLGALGDLVVVVDRAPRGEEIDRRLEDDPEMTDGNPLVAAPVRVVGLDLATGEERWAAEVLGDVGSALVTEQGIVVAAAREDASGTLLSLGLDGKLLSEASIPPPPEEEPDEPPPYAGVPRLLGIRRGAVVWQGPRGIGASPVDRLASPSWAMDEPALGADGLVADAGEPLWVHAPHAVVTDDLLILRADDRLVSLDAP